MENRDLEYCSESVCSDRSHLGWALLGFFVPVAGFVLFFVMKDNRPKTAKTLGIASLISSILIFLFYTACFIGVYLIGG